MLEIKNLSVISGRRLILDDITLSVKPHTVTAILGRNAAGKSTLLSCFTGERKYTGSISFSGKNLAMIPQRERAALVSLLPQNLPKVSLTVKELVRLGRTPHLDFAGHFSDEDELQVKLAVEQTGIAHLENRPVSELSGGERQKAYLAMTLAQNTRLIAFDEPTTYMDVSHEKEFSSLLVNTVRKQKKTALIVMHDLTRAVEIADSIAVISDGRLLIHDSTENVVKSGIIEKEFSVSCYNLDGIRIYR